MKKYIIISTIALTIVQLQSFGAQSLRRGFSQAGQQVSRYFGTSAPVAQPYAVRTSGLLPQTMQRGGLYTLSGGTPAVQPTATASSLLASPRSVSGLLVRQPLADSRSLIPGSPATATRLSNRFSVFRNGVPTAQSAMTSAAPESESLSVATQLPPAGSSLSRLQGTFSSWMPWAKEAEAKRKKEQALFDAFSVRNVNDLVTASYDPVQRQAMVDVVKDNPAAAQLLAELIHKNILTFLWTNDSISFVNEVIQASPEIVAPLVGAALESNLVEQLNHLNSGQMDHLLTNLLANPNAKEELTKHLGLARVQALQAERSLEGLEGRDATRKTQEDLIINRKAWLLTILTMLGLGKAVHSQFATDQRPSASILTPIY